MVDLAIWIVAACIVIPFVIWAVILALGGSIALFSNGRWIWLVFALVCVIVWIARISDENSKKAEAQQTRNISLQQQCKSKVNENTQILYDDAIAKNLATQTYVDRLSTSKLNAHQQCKIKYPVYLY